MFPWKAKFNGSEALSFPEISPKVSAEFAAQSCRNSLHSSENQEVINRSKNPALFDGEPGSVITLQSPYGSTTHWEIVGSGSVARILAKEAKARVKAAGGQFFGNWDRDDSKSEGGAS